MDLFQKKLPETQRFVAKKWKPIIITGRLQEINKKPAIIEEAEDALLNIYFLSFLPFDLNQDYWKYGY